MEMFFQFRPDEIFHRIFPPVFRGEINQIFPGGRQVAAIGINPSPEPLSEPKGIVTPVPADHGDFVRGSPPENHGRAPATGENDMQPGRNTHGACFPLAKFHVFYKNDHMA